MFAFGSNGESPALKLKTWHNIPLTPGRIPSFYVPSRLHLSVSPRFKKPKDTDEYQLLSPSSPEQPSPVSHSPSASSPCFPVKLRFTPQSNRKRGMKDTSDPSTRAAMSLKHVEKVTTPYGFRTLAASPNVSRRESLFHRRRGQEGCQSPASSPALPQLGDSSISKTAAQDVKPSPEPSCSTQKSEKKRLKMLFKTRTALKSLTPRSRRKEVKVQDVL